MLQKAWGVQIFNGMTKWLRLPSAMVARLASIAQRYQKVAGSSPAVVNFFWLDFHSILRT